MPSILVAEDQADKAADLFDNYPAEVDIDKSITLRIFGEDAEKPEWLIQASGERTQRAHL